MIIDVTVTCPYCSETFGTLIDGSPSADLEGVVDSAEPAQDGEAWEDCAVCCKPILLRWSFDEDGALQRLDAFTDDE